MSDEIFCKECFISECCGAKSLGEVYYTVNKAILGICADCRDQAVFTAVENVDE